MTKSTTYETKTVINLGQGTVDINNVYLDEKGTPCGIQFTQSINSNEESVVIYLPNNQAVAEYMSAALNFLKANSTEKTTPQFLEKVNNLELKYKTIEQQQPKK